MNNTEILYLNHSSVLIRFQNEYLLCDPWFERPAFGSWLPTYPLFVHPSYISSLEDKLTILISHGHDDHCDDEMLKLFNKNTPVVSSNFASPSVKNRVKKIGFDNYNEASEDGITLKCFQIRSYRNSDISEDDALYTIKTPDALIIHANDNWFKIEEKNISLIRELINEVGEQNAIYMSQTNSASGFPLNYTNYTEVEKLQILRTKVKNMISTGLQNCLALGIKNFHSYAGYASVFVKDKNEYLKNSLFPTPQFIKREFPEIIPPSIEILDFSPGDIFNFKTIKKSFFTDSYSDDQIKSHSTNYYESYGIVNQCDSYKQGPDRYTKDELIKKLEFFLTKFDEFVIGKVSRSNFHGSILGKRLKISVPELEVNLCLEFGKGICADSDANKTVVIKRKIIEQVLSGEVLFENLYTGYNAEFQRNPVGVYNRDIVMYMVMFSYVYKNRLANQ